jgi:hypothetical protein
VSHPDPLAADRRVAVVGIVALVVFVAIGVVSASLLTGSACDDLVPRPVADTSAPPEVREELAPVLDPLAQHLGDVRAVLSAVEPATASVVDGHLALLGGRAVVLDATPAAIDLDGRVVGSGTTLFALAWINDLTGQVDALQPMTTTLQPGPCLDTAVVGEPFAFHLDAGGGALLLLRVDEDGRDPDIELRDGSGRRWRAPLPSPTAPPGLLGDRTAGLLAGDLVLVARQGAGHEPEPVVLALEPADGSERWALTTSALPNDPAAGDAPIVWRPVAVTATTAVVVRDGSTLVGLDAMHGEVRWQRPLGGMLLDAAVVDGTLVVAVATEDGVTVEEIADSGEAARVGGLPAADTAVVLALDDGALVGTSSGWLLTGPAGERARDDAPAIMAGAHLDGATLLVVALDDGVVAVLLDG